MERKTITAYVSVLEQFAAICAENNIEVETVVTDYETGLQTAIARIFPTANITGCYFHFARAIYMRYKANGLARGPGEKLRRPIIKMCMCLALLPNDRILNAIALIRG